MVCRNCGSLFLKRRSIKDLFSLKEDTICPGCYKKYQFNINYEVIPLDNHLLEIITLYPKQIYINFACFEDLAKELLGYLKKISKNKHIEYVRILRIDDEIIEYYECLARKKNKNILILTFYTQID